MHEECMFFPTFCDMISCDVIMGQFWPAGTDWASMIYSKAMRQNDLTVT